MNHYADQIELHLDCKVRIYLIPKQPASSFLGEGGGAGASTAAGASAIVEITVGSYCASCWARRVFKFAVSRQRICPP